MKRIALAGVSVALASLVLAAGASAQPSLLLTPTGPATFPSRLFVLTMPSGAQADPAKVRVTENGASVTHLSATAAGSSPKNGTVLVIDASDSMRGEAIRDAMTAARVFANARRPGQQLGVIAFSKSVTTLTALTSDPGPIRSALATAPRLSGGTRLYDAVRAAVSMLQGQGVTGGSVVVLSDGADTGSGTSFDQLAATARAGGVRVFTVGLRSSSFDITALERLAAAARGEYSEAGSPKDLASIYQQLGSRLAGEILLRYQSRVPRGNRVLVNASVPGIDGYATSEYVAPRRPGEDAAPGATGFWGSTVVMVAASVVAGILLGIAVLLLMMVRRRKLVRARMEGFVALPPGMDAATWGSALAGSLVARAERSLERAKQWPALIEELEIARIPIEPTHFVLWVGAATIASFVLLVLAMGTVLAGMAAFLIPLVTRVTVKRRALQRRKAFGDQLADNLQVVASAMRAGHSLIGALSVAADDAAEPVRSELRRVVADEQLGVPLDDALRTAMRRMQSSDLEQLVLVSVVQRETGGNTAEVIDRVAANIRERAELRRMIDTLTAQGRLSRWVVSSLPVVLLALITAINPTYMQPLYHTGVGRLMLGLAVGLVIMGSLAIKRVVDIKV
jgi:tight adherence protein B